MVCRSFIKMQYFRLIENNFPRWKKTCYLYEKGGRKWTSKDTKKMAKEKQIHPVANNINRWQVIGGESYRK